MLLATARIHEDASPLFDRRGLERYFGFEHGVDNLVKDVGFELSVILLLFHGQCS